MTFHHAGRAALGIAMAGLLASTAPGSDFSALGRPEVVRSVLIPQPRLRELQCAAFAAARGAPENILTPALRDALREAVTERVAIDVGDAAYARDMLRDRAQGFVDDPTWPFPDSRKAEIAGVRADCKAFFAEVGAKDITASLSPAPTGPIALPDGATCLAAMKDADRRGLDLGQDQGEPYFEQLLLEAPELPERDANRTAVAAAKTAFGRKPLSKEELEMTINFSCMPALAALAKRFPPPFDDEVER